MAAFAFRRGWLAQLHLANLALPLARALKREAAGRMLLDLMIDSAGDYSEVREPDDGVPPNEHNDAVGLGPLTTSPYLANVRRFRLGAEEGDDYVSYTCYMHSTVVVPLVSRMPRLEELYLFANGYDLNELFVLPTLGRLRVLQLYHVEQVHRLQLLAESATFRNLTHLLLHPHNADAWWGNSRIDEPAGYRREDGYLPLSVVRPLLHSRNLPALTHLRLRCSSMGDEGCREIVRSGILRRLRTLDLRHGAITDEGARLLCQCPDLRRLEWLDLDRNALTAEGVTRVRAVGIPARVDNQQSAAEVGERQYLREGEFE